MNHGWGDLRGEEVSSFSSFRLHDCISIFQMVQGFCCVLAHFLDMWPFLRVSEKEFRGESPWRWFEVWSLPLIDLVRSTVSSNVYSEVVRQRVEGELDSESEWLWYDISFALNSTEPLGICLTFSNSQIKHLWSEGDGSTCVLCESK